MATCKHIRFDISTIPVANANRTKYRIDIKVKCGDCGAPFRFEKSYVSSTDGLELTAEIVPGARDVNKQLPKKVLKEMNEWQL